MRVWAIWVAAPESTISLPITAPNTTMIASEPRVLPKPVIIVSSREPRVSSSPGIHPASTETISATPISSAASNSASIALSLYLMLSTSIRPMPSTIHRMCSHSIGPQPPRRHRAGCGSGAQVIRRRERSGDASMIGGRRLRVLARYGAGRGRDSAVPLLASCEQGHGEQKREEAGAQWRCARDGFTSRTSSPCRSPASAGRRRCPASTRPWPARCRPAWEPGCPPRAYPGSSGTCPPGRRRRR